MLFDRPADIVMASHPALDKVSISHSVSIFQAWKVFFSDVLEDSRGINHEYRPENNYRTFPDH